VTRAAFRQADIERIIRAAKAAGAIVQIDLRTLVVTIHPDRADGIKIPASMAPDGPENWDDLQPEDFTSLAEWQAWRDRERVRETAAAQSSPKRRLGRRPKT